MKKKFILFFITIIISLYITIINQIESSPDKIFEGSLILFFIVGGGTVAFLNIFNPLLLKYNIYGNFKKFRELEYEKYLENFEISKNKKYLENKDYFDEKKNLQEIKILHDKEYQKYINQLKNYTEEPPIGYGMLLASSFIITFIISSSYFSISSRINLIESITPFSKKEIYEHVYNYDDKREEFFKTYIYKDNSPENNFDVKRQDKIMIINTKSSANIRNGPGTNYSKIDNIKTGEKIRVIGIIKEKDWYKVFHNEKVGFIHKSLLEDIL